MEEEKIIKEYYPYLKLTEYKGKKIISIDFSNLLPDEVVKNVPLVREVVDTFPKDKSLLMLTDFTNMRYSKDSLSAAKQFTRDNEPYLKRSAMIGITGLLNIGAKAMVTFSRRDNIYPFDTRQEALDWLVK